MVILVNFKTGKAGDNSVSRFALHSFSYNVLGSFNTKVTP